MGILDILSNFRDVFEVGRKTTTDKKDNKSKKRNFDFEDGEKMPSSRKEYKKNKAGSNNPSRSSIPQKLNTKKTKTTETYEDEREF